MGKRWEKEEKGGKGGEGGKGKGTRKKKTRKEIGKHEKKNKKMRKMRKENEEKMKNAEKWRNLASHAKSSASSRVYWCCCNFFVEILDDFHDFVSECFSFQKKINNPFCGVTFSRRKVTTFHWTWNKTHILPKKIDEQPNSLRSAHLTIIILLE